MITGTGNKNRSRGRQTKNTVGGFGHLFTNNIFLIALAVIAVAMISVMAAIAVISDDNGGRSSIVTPWPTLQITPAPIATPTPTPTPTPMPATSETNDTSFEAYQDVANSAGNNQTPNEYIVNLTGNSFVDYTALADMYPWYRGYNDSAVDKDGSPLKWMWTPEKFSREMCGQGDAQRVMLYNLWMEKQVVKAPSINLEILHNDDKTPYDFNREAIVLGKYYDGYFRFTNTGDKPFQGDIAVAINASLFFAGQLVHLENMIITNQFLSLYPGQSNDFYEKWYIKDFNGVPIPTGCLNIVIELRDKSDGSTLYSKTIKPQVARDPYGNGELTF